MRYILYFFYFWGLALAQETSYKKSAVYTVKDGLLSNTIYDVIEDDNGFIWLATESGAMRFDGKKFERFSTKEMPDRTCLFIKKDSKKRLWFFFWGEICIWDHGKILNRHNNKLLNSLYGKERYTSFVESGSGIWLGDMGEVFTYIENERIVSQQNHPHYQLVWKYQDLLCIGGLDGRVRSLNQPFVPLRIKSPFRDKAHISFNLGQAWLASDSLWVLNNKKINVYPLPTKDAKTLSLLDKQTWAITAQNGVFLVNHEGKPLEHLLKGYSCSQVCMDAYGNLLVSTLEQGLILLRHSTGNFQRLAINMTKDESIGGICMRHPHLYFTTQHHWYKMDLKTGKYLSHKLPSNIGDLAPEIYEYKKRIFIGGQKRQLTMLSQKSPYRIITNIYTKNTEYFDSLSCSSGFNSFSLLNLNTKSKFTFIPFYHRDIQLQHLNFLSIFPFKAYQYYLCTRKGLYSFDLQTCEYSSYTSIHPALAEKISCIYYDSLTCTFFLGVESYGLLQFDGEKVIRIINENDGLFHNGIKQILSTNEGSLWILHDYGLTRISGDRNRWKDMKYTIYNEKKGLTAETNRQMIASGDSLWLSSNQGIFFLNTESKLTVLPKFFPEINIEHDAHRVLNTNYYSFDYDFLPITIDISYAHLAEISNLGFFYKLNDQPWQSMRSSALSLPDLAPGYYNLQIEVRGDGYKSDTANCAIIVEPLWWQRKDVRIAFSLSVIISVFIFIFRRIKQKQAHILAEKDKQEEMGRLRSVALLNQMNPHFIFNALTTLQNHILNSNVRQANTFIHSFARLLRLLLKVSQLASLPLKQEIEFLSLYLSVENMKASSNFTWTIEVDDELFEQEKIPPLILQPFVENAIKHGINSLKDEKGDIFILFEPHVQDIIKCTIRDNGVGFQEKDFTKNESLGLSIIKERLSLYPILPKPAFEITQQSPSGVQVIVYLPIL